MDSEHNVFLLKPDALGGVKRNRISNLDHFVILGGAGFLGSNLCELYVKNGARVTCLDNLQTGRLENIAHLMQASNFKFLCADITDEIKVCGDVDFIYNLACPASPPKYQIDALGTFHTCVIGTENALKLAERKGARILQASTSEVYGDPDVAFQEETYRGNVNTMGPRACYDEGKRAAETLIYEYHRHFGVDTRICRIFNTYGPRMDPGDGRVISNFITQALKGEDITIYGNGSQTRSFCYVDDLIAGIFELMHSEQPYYEPVNLGNPEEFNMLELTQIVLELTNSQSKLVYCDLPVDDPTHRCPDITRARKILGWSPSVRLREGISCTIPYFVEQVEREKSRKGVMA